MTLDTARSTAATPAPLPPTTAPGAPPATGGRWVRPTIAAVVLVIIALTTWTILQTPTVEEVDAVPIVDGRNPSIRQLERGMLDARGRLEQLDRREVTRFRNRVDAATAGGPAVAGRSAEQREVQRLRNRAAATGTSDGAPRPPDHLTDADLGLPDHLTTH